MVWGAYRAFFTSVGIVDSTRPTVKFPFITAGISRVGLRLGLFERSQVSGDGFELGFDVGEGCLESRC